VPQKSNNGDKDSDARLDVVIKLLAAILTRDLEKGEAIIKLDKMAVSREMIADAVGVTMHNVAQVLYAAGRRAEGKVQKRAKRNRNQAEGEQL
jgi:hypothetical protein